jgi:hypothetical protein
MTDSADAGLFPLPLVAFEDYMLTDDCADYPATFFFRLRFAGRWDRAGLAAAAAVAVARHPLLRAVVRRSQSGRPEWVAAEDPQPAIDWHGGALPAAAPADWHIDLYRQTGLRIAVVEQGDATEMLLQFHHACCDGMGALQFIADLLQAYHERTSPSAANHPPRPLDPRRLRQRGKFGLTPLGYLLRLPVELAGLVGSLEYFLHRPAALAGPADGNACTAAGFPAILAHTFSQAETEDISRIAAREGGTVNDFLLRNLFVVASAWNVERDPKLRRRYVRIMVPMNLRGPADDAMPAANVVSMIHIDRRPHKAGSFNAQARLARVELRLCKKWRLGLTTVHYMQVFRRFRNGLKRLIPKHRCLGTTVLSNLGDPVRHIELPRRNGRIIVGGLTLEAIEPVPPVRPFTRASYGAVFYAGRLTLTVHYDPRCFTPEEGRELLDRFVAEIRRAIADGAE